MNRQEFSHLTSEEVFSALQQQVLLLPVGSTEQHGPHLPLSVDVDIPEAICRAVAAKVRGLIAPAISYGARSLPQSGGGLGFPGTIYLRGATFISYVTDILSSFVSAGARRIVVLNGHYENEALIFEAIDALREGRQLEQTEVMALSWWSVVDTRLLDELYGPVFVGWHAEHASLVETSLMQSICPQKVRDIRVNHASPPPAGIYLHPVESARSSTRGVLHRTAEASAASGKAIFDVVVEAIAALVSTHFNLE